MKIYVAARFHEKERVQEIYKKLKGFGHEITVDWTQCTTQKPYDAHLADAQECARHAISGVAEAEVFIFLTNPEVGAGSSAELGAALMSHQLRGFPIIYSVGSFRENNIILYHSSIVQCETITDVYADLKNLQFRASKAWDTQPTYPRVGIGIIVLNNNNNILLGKRKNIHGDEQWAPPGGHLEFGESPVVCAKRELLEETGLALLNAKEISFTNDVFFKEHKHYISIFVQGTVQGEPKIIEPDKCSEWKWFDWNELPSPLFLSFQNFIQQKQ